MESLGNPIGGKDDKKAGETEGNFLLGLFGFIGIGGGGEIDEPCMNEHDKQNETSDDKEIREN